VSAEVVGHIMQQERIRLKRFAVFACSGKCSQILRPGEAVANGLEGTANLVGSAGLEVIRFEVRRPT